MNWQAKSEVLIVEVLLSLLEGLTEYIPAHYLT